MHIRNYNSALAMTSVGRKLDHSVNNGGGPWLYKLNGELIHRAGSLLPPEEGNVAPVYSQLWVIDTQEALDIRMHNQYNRLLDLGTLRTLQDMLYRHHPGVALYKHAYELTCNMSREQQCNILFHFDAACDKRRYNAPDASVREIAVILQGDGEEVRESQDIIIHRKHGDGLQRISDCHPFYPCLRYILLFPTGQLGWHPAILYEQTEDQADDPKQKYVSLAGFNKYRLHIRPENVESIHLFLTGKLFQEYVCEAWAVAEQNRLNWIRLNQTKLRVELYKGLQDAVAANPEADWDQLGKRFILPSSFTGSTRNMQQHLQDALAINCFYGGGDLFVTITANPSWPEIKDALFPGQTASDRPNLVVRVFHTKLKSLIKEIRGSVLCYTPGWAQDNLT